MWCVVIVLLLVAAVDAVLQEESGRVVEIYVIETELGYFRSSEVSLDLKHQRQAKYYPFADVYYYNKDLQALAISAYGLEVKNTELWNWVPYEVGSKRPLRITSDTDHPDESWRYALLGYLLHPVGVMTSAGEAYFSNKDPRCVELVFLIDTETSEREEYLCYYSEIHDTETSVGSISSGFSTCYSRADTDYAEPIRRISSGLSTDTIRSVNITLVF